MMTMGCLESQDLHHAPGGGGGGCFLLDDLSAAVAGDGDDFDAMEIWLEGGVDHHQEHHPHHDFPPLPAAAGDYYPCISSSSSSTSSAPPPGHPNPSCSSSASSSSSSAAPWAFLKSDPDESEPAANKIHLPCAAAAPFDAPPLPEESFTEDDCIDVLDNLSYMDDFITGDADLWENCSIFPTAAPEECRHQTALAAEAEGEIITYHEEEEEKKTESPAELPFLQGNGELAAIFFDWLKQNKDHISAEDMRSIKLKRSTIETASKRLGTSKEGKKQLLKLILDWVQQYQLQKKLRSDEAQPPLLLPPPPGDDDGVCFYLPPPFPPADPVGPAHPPPFSVFHPPPQHYVASDPYGNYVGGVPPYCHFHQQMDSNQSWPSPSEFPASSQPFAAPFPDNDGNAMVASDQGGYPFPLLDVNLGSSATKEARKKRMARQRRLASNHHHHHFRHQNSNTMRLAGGGGGAVENCGVVLPLHRHQAINSNNFGNWMYWSPAAVSDPRPPPPPMVVEAPQPPPQAERQPPVPVAQPHHQNNNPKQGSSERRQGTNKTEKNLRFLLQKVLKQSDVGSLGRIVLPKKEAETQLPELESRDGISIAMEDIGTSRVWNMKYRFWPNNKSRMYLLENTGEFVRANALQEGDFIVIYADTKSGKYLIRGVKVRPNGPKSDIIKKQTARKSTRPLPTVTTFV